MPLTLSMSQSADIGSASIVDPLRSSVARHGETSLLVSNVSQIIPVKKALAELGLGIGVGVYTPHAWVSEQWRLFGDGTMVAPKVLVVMAMKLQLDTLVDFDLSDGLDTTMGTAEVLADMCDTLLPFLPRADLDVMRRWRIDSDVLLPKELRAIDVAWSGVDALAAKGFLPYGFAAAKLCGALPSSKSVVMRATTTMDLATTAMLIGLGDGHDVAIASCPPPGVSGNAMREQFDILAGAGVSSEIEYAEPEPKGTNRELLELKSILFGEQNRKIEPTGSVELLEAAGVSAESELVVRKIQQLAKGGAKKILVVAPSAYESYKSLAQKFCARGMTTCVRTTVPFELARSGYAFRELLDSVSGLQKLANEWTQIEDPESRLNDMNWWPPSGLVDALSSCLSGLKTGAVWKLDQEWRGNRILTPEDVLTRLSNVARSNGCSALDAAISALRQGRIGTAAAKLRDALPKTPSYAMDRSALDGAVVIVECMHSLGLHADEDALQYNAKLFGEVMSYTGSSVSEELVAPDSPCVVEITTPQVAASMEQGSMDAVVCLDMTTVGWPVKPNDDALSRLVERLDTARAIDALDVERECFYRILDVARDHVVFERSLHDVDSKETYAAVVLTEVLSCYKQGIPTETLDESDISSNLSFRGCPARKTDEYALQSEGTLSEGLREYVCPPRNGEDNSALPVLSASQIESYLECPLKWFTLRRLALSSIDAGFDAVEIGSFMHRVLELSHKRLLDEAAQAIGCEPDSDPFARIPGSRVDASTYDMYLEFLKESFDEHLDHQMKFASKLNEQALVPHNAREQYRLLQLRKQLKETAFFEKSIFQGFEPRWFELKFGAESLEAEYAGAKIVGTVDRVDVDCDGNALIIDYKCKKGLSQGYSLVTSEEFRPRHIQSLLYSKILPGLIPGLKPVGALYFGVSMEPEITGAMAPGVVDRVYGKPVSAARYEKVTPDAYGMSFEELLERTEEYVANAVSSMLSGNIEADPIDKNACSYCPVAFCEKRMS